MPAQGGVGGSGDWAVGGAGEGDGQAGFNH